MSKADITDAFRALFDTSEVDRFIETLRDSIEQAEQIKSLAIERIKDEKQLREFVAGSDKAIKSYRKQIGDMEKLKAQKAKFRDKMSRSIAAIGSPPEKKASKKGGKK